MKQIDKIHCKLLLRCDMECPFCYFKDKNNLQYDLDLNKLRRILEDLNTSNQLKKETSITLSGGEPLLYDQLHQLLLFLYSFCINEIKIKTNLKNFDKLLSVLPIFEEQPDRLKILPDCHFEMKTEEEKIQFLDNVKTLQDLGFKSKIVYTIASGDYFDEQEIKENAALLNSYNLPYKLNPIRHKNLDNNSTEEYTENQRSFLLSIDKDIFLRNKLSSNLNILTIEANNE